MNAMPSIEPVTALRSQSSALIRRARDAKEPIIITQNGRATAVLQDIDSYQHQQEQLLMLKYLAQGEQSLRTKPTIPHEKMKRIIAERFAQAKSHE